MHSVKTLIAIALLFSAPFSASAAEALSAGQKSEVEQLVREYILGNPEIIAEAIGELQRREKIAAAKRQAETAERQRETLKTMATELASSPNDPVIGNPNGDVTVVEFFDYRCGYCKRVFDDVQALLKEDGNIKYVLKEFPILGPDSTYASRAAMAVWLHQKDKYLAFHTAMLSNKGALGNDKVMELAEDSGVDVKALAQQMDDTEIAETFATTRLQAQALDLTGTPAFIIGQNIAPGAISLVAMKQMVDAARGKSPH